MVQAVGPYDLRLALELPPGVSGPLHVEVMPEGPPAEAALTLTAVPAGADVASTPPRRLDLAPGVPGPFLTQLTVDGPGAWELLLRAEGTAGSGEARFPFTVEVPDRPVAGVALAVALGSVGALLLLGIVAVGAESRGRAMPRWLPWTISHGAVACLTVAAVAGAWQAFSPPVDRPPGGAAAARPHVDLLLRSEPAEPEAGAPLTLLLDLVDGATGRTVDDLALHHEALLHGVLIGDDGGFFAHVHPARVAPGRFSVGVIPDRPGDYTFYAEVTRRGGGSQVAAAPLRVTGSGGGPPPVARSPLGQHEAADLRVEGSADSPTFRAGAPVTLSFHVTRDGRPVDDLQPWLGMPGHLVVRGVDDALFAHVHAAGAMQGAAGGTGTTDRGSIPGGFGSGVDPAAEAPRFGPAVGFTYTFPKAGSYLLWVQFKHADRVLTLPFRVDVSSKG